MELNPDIQTGRNVYADKDLYESDDAYKAKIDSYVKEGFKLVYGDPDEPSEGGGSGGSESLIVHNVKDEENDTISLDKTWKEIYDAMPNVLVIDNESLISGESYDEIYYETPRLQDRGTDSDVRYTVILSQISYYTGSVNGYPTKN